MMCRDKNPDSSTISECSPKSIKEHKSHNNIETAVSRGEVGGMGDSMGGDGLEVAVSLKISRTLLSVQPQGCTSLKASHSCVKTGRAVEDIHR